MDVWGAVLLIAALGWTYLAAVVSGGRASPVVGAFLLAGVGYVAGRIGGTYLPALIPGAVALVAVAIAARAPADVLSSDPLSGPFGYANAKGAFFALAAVAALMVAASSIHVALRIPAVLAAVALAAVPFVVRSFAPGALLLLLVPLGLLPWSARSVRIAVAGSALAVMIAIGATSFLAVSYHPWPPDRGAVEDRVTEALTERRIALWRDAIELVRDRPVTGVGPSRFAVTSPIARADEDARWAHHAFLQQGAEQGAPGLAILLAVFGWAFAGLLLHPRPTRYVALGAVGLAVVGVHASIDYALHFPAVPVAAAAVAGSATAVARRAR